MKPTKRLCASEGLQHSWIVSVTRDKSYSNVTLSTKMYRENFAEERKLKRVGSRFDVINAPAVVPDDDADMTTHTSGKMDYVGGDREAS